MANSSSAAVLTGLDQTEALVAQAMTSLREGTASDFLWQLAACAVAIGFAWAVSRKFNRWLAGFAPGEEGVGFLDKIKESLIGIVLRLSFSLVAASTLLLIALGLDAANALEGGKTFFLSKLGCLIFYLFALLRVILYALRGMMGARIVNAFVTRVVTVSFWILVVLEFLGVLPKVIGFLKDLTIPIGGQEISLWTGFTGVLSALLTIGVANWLANVVEMGLDKSEAMTDNLRIVLARVCRWILLLVAVLVALNSVGIDLTVLSVFGGAVGVGIGFGLQKIASNYISGFIILLDRSVKIGDYIEIGSFAGTVKEINTRYTVVRDNSGVENIVPNETFVTSSVKNYYYSDNACVVRIEVGISYESDLAKALAILREESERPARVMRDRKGWVGIVKLGESEISLAAGVWVRNIGTGTMGLRTEILTNVLRRYAEEGIEIPYSKLDINLKRSSPSARK